MKSVKKYHLFIIFIFIVSIDYLGLYQWSNIEVDDISIEKPFGYKYSSASSIDDNSTFSIFKNIMGLKTKNNLLPNHFLRLEFKQFFLNKSTRIVLFKLSENDIKFLKNTNIGECTSSGIVRQNSEYIIENIIYKFMYEIYIVSDNKEDALYFYHQICKEP